MSYLEELLPEFRKVAKIRNCHWNKGEYICIKNNVVVDEYEAYPSAFCIEYLKSNEWEFYQEPINWDYIIKNKCLCWFWDDEGEKNKHIGILKELKKYETYKFSIITPDNYVNDISFTNCRPVRRDEVTFYEDKKNEI